MLLALSLPFWVAGAMADNLSKLIRVNLPMSALMTVCPLIAAAILVRREDGPGGVKRLFRRVFDLRGIKPKVWYLPIFLLMPALLFLSYWVMRLLGLPLPEPQIPILTAPLLFVMYLAAAICEETGWMGYVADPVQERWGALTAGLAIGTVWALWHLLPFIQGHHSVYWLVGQCLHTVALRVLLVWLYNNAGKTVLAAAICHAMYNVSWSLFPNFGSHYDPVVVAGVEALAVVVVTFIWGARTLAGKPAA